jgi:hypothetical protein
MKPEEMEFASAVEELAAEAQPSGGTISKAMQALVNIVKGGKKASTEDRLDDLLDEYGMDDEEEGEGVDEDELEDEEDEMEPPKPKGKGKPPVRKSLAEEMADDGYSDVLDGNEFVKSLLTGVDDRIARRDADTQQQIGKLRKAIVGMGDQLSSINEALEGLGRLPAGRTATGAAPYQVREPMSKSTGGVQFPPEEKALAQAGSAMRKGLITAAERRTIELAYENNQPRAAAHVLHKIQQAGGDET